MTDARTANRAVASQHDPDTADWFRVGRTDWRDRPRLNRLAFGLIAVQALVVYFLILPGSLYADDFREGTRAALDPWSMEWILGFDTYRHFSPIMRGYYSLFEQVAPLSYPIGALAAVALLCATSLALWALLRATVGSTYIALGGLALFTVVPMTISVTMWMAQAVVTLPVVLGGLLAGLGLVRYLERPARRHLALLVGGYLLPLLTWEKGLIVPAILVGFAAFLVSPTLRYVDLRRTVARSWQVWLLLAAVSVAYLIVWTVGGFGTDSPLPTAWDMVYGFTSSFAELLVPSIVGGPWNWYAAGEHNFYPIASTPQVGVALAAALFATLLTLAGARVTSAAWRCVAFIVWVSAFSIALPLIGRFGQFGVSVSYESRYLLDALPWAIVSLAILAAKTLRPVSSWSSPTRNSGRRNLRWGPRWLRLSNSDCLRGGGRTPRARTQMRRLARSGRCLNRPSSSTRKCLPMCRPVGFGRSIPRVCFSIPAPRRLQPGSEQRTQMPCSRQKGSS